jgi:hypothetical protein
MTYEKFITAFYYGMAYFTSIAIILTMLKLSLQIYYLKEFVKGKIIPNVVIFTYSSGIKNQSLPKLNVRYLLLQLILSTMPPLYFYQIYNCSSFLFKLAIYYVNRKCFISINRAYLRFTYRINDFLDKRLM